MKTFLADSLNKNVPFHLMHFGDWSEGSKSGGLPVLPAVADFVHGCLEKGSVVLWHFVSLVDWVCWDPGES